MKIPSDQTTLIREVPLDSRVPFDLPAGSEVMDVAYVSDHSEGRPVLLEFPHPLQRRAIRLNVDDRDASVDLSILTVPTKDHQDESLLRAARSWVTRGPGNAATVNLMTLQGAQLFWCERRVAIVAHADRIDTVRLAMIEASYFQFELHAIEQMLGENWPALEADMPLAFEFDNRSIGRRQQLLQRFQQVLHVRMRLARIAPMVHAPHVHPATLASQIGERFRERTRMLHRHEALGEQLEVFERVYESCGQKASDFMLTRSSNTLEWVIIVLLVTQLLLHGFDLLTTLGPATGL